MAPNWPPIQAGFQALQLLLLYNKQKANSKIWYALLNVGDRGNSQVSIKLLEVFSLNQAAQVLEVFEHLAQLGREANRACVSNGVLLESQ